ncbi:small ribosomal subunit protein uS7m [Trichomonascus vanleenenianus]|uniref:mitochondrial 37S ribosomal protein uS7m RSM7 n=1 Tax=Trichomonascus vanleenenianus TaxID=2268995 RepID=UPI003EC95F70
MIARRLFGASSRRLFSSAAVLLKKEPQGEVFNSAAKALVGLRKAEGVESLPREEADKIAEEWIASLRELRTDLVDENGKYYPSKAFAPEGVAEIDIFQQVIDEKASEKFVPSEQQQEEFLKVKSTPIPARRDETMNYLTNMIMRAGKKARAEKLMGQALYLVHLKKRTDPVALLKRILEDMAPVVKLKRYSDGGARSELVPTPLTERQRLRQSWLWLLESANKRPSKDFSVRLAEEILAAADGRSPGFEKRVQQHKLAIVNRSFVKLLTKKRR